MPTYRTAPNLGKPPRPELLTKRGRRATREGAEAMRAASAGRKWGSKAALEAAAREAARRDALAVGPHPLPVERIDVAALKGSAKSLAKYGLGLGLVVRAAGNGRDVEVRIGRCIDTAGTATVVGRAVFRDGRLVHAFAHVDGSMRKRTLTALKAELAKAAAS